MASVTLLIGSKSDADAVRPALQTLEHFGVSCQPIICSAHRAPERLRQVVRDAEAGGTQLFVCGAGLAAARRTLRELYKRWGKVRPGEALELTVGDFVAGP